jgi:flavin-dependent dehydrogenase
VGEVDVCVVGAGPAGTTVAARLAQLGHRVLVVERATFPRRRLGESLTPGVLALLEASGARAAVEPLCRPVRGVDVAWEGPARRRDDADGWLVDRGAFDAALLEHARAGGVDVAQPAVVRARRRTATGWVVDVDGRGAVACRYVVDATGRRTARGPRRPTGARTLALHAYWRAGRLPQRPRIEALDDAWCWGVPLPDGTYDTIAFVDPASGAGAPAARLASVLERSGLFDRCHDLTLDGPVEVVDATAYCHEAPMAEGWLAVGDAAVALDPLSSSGVQRAVQTALAAAVVVNTVLRRPASAALAAHFYEARLREASERHRAWAAEHYAAAAVGRPTPFWAVRAAGSDPRPLPEPAGRPATPPRPDTVVALSPLCSIVATACLEGDLVVERAAVAHPALDEPVAYVGGCALVPLLGSMTTGSTLAEVARHWSGRAPDPAALAVWLYRRGLLVEAS